MATTVGPDGQMVIEPHIREELGIEPGWIAVQRLVNGHLEVRFQPPAPSDEEMDAALARAFADDWRETERRMRAEGTGELRTVD